MSALFQEPIGLDPHQLCYFDSRLEQFETKIYPVIDSAIIGVLPLTTWLVLLLFTAYKYSG